MDKSQCLYFLLDANLGEQLVFVTSCSSRLRSVKRGVIALGDFVIEESDLVLVKCMHQKIISLQFGGFLCLVYTNHLFDFSSNQQHTLGLFFFEVFGEFGWTCCFTRNCLSSLCINSICSCTRRASFHDKRNPLPHTKPEPKITTQTTSLAIQTNRDLGKHVLGVGMQLRRLRFQISHARYNTD